jgi:hypothetical protein
MRAGRRLALGVPLRTRSDCTSHEYPVRCTKLVAPCTLTAQACHRLTHLHVLCGCRVVASSPPQLLIGALYMLPKYTLRFFFWRSIVSDMAHGCVDPPSQLQPTAWSSRARSAASATQSPSFATTLVASSPLDAEPISASILCNVCGRLVASSCGVSVDTAVGAASSMSRESRSHPAHSVANAPMPSDDTRNWTGFACAMRTDIREVRNPDKIKKRQEIARNYALEPELFERSYQRKRRVFWLLP